MAHFSPNELRRYARHFSLSEVGTQGQEKLRQAKVLVVGAGGLASPVLQYLAAAGVGTLGVVDDDNVDISNLQRQVVFATSDQGRAKVDICRARIIALNPNVNVITHNTALTDSNALTLIQDYDIVVDCTDNFATRYTVNDACGELKKPNVYASISQFDGQCTVFTAQDGPCYRCVYPEAPPEGLIPNCAEAGVMGALPGILGTLQAMQTITLILGIGEPLIGRLLLVDALNFRFRELPITRSVDCACCVQHLPFKDLPRPAFRCNLDDTMTPEISVPEFIELQKQRPIFILDVRQPEEYETVNMQGHLIPLNELEDRLDEIDQSKPIVVHCRSGMRSAQAVALLAEHGITSTNLQGGILAWLEYHDNA